MKKTELEINKDSTGKGGLYVLFAGAILIFGTAGAFFGFLVEVSVLSSVLGFLLGSGLAVVFVLLGFAWESFGYPVWERFQGDLEERKLYAYLTIGFICAIGVSGFIALAAGNPSCLEQDLDGCVQYADDGHQASPEQMWGIFWDALPMAVVISCLIAALMHSRSR